MPRGISDQSLLNLLADETRHEFRYLPARQQWYRWLQTYWQSFGAREALKARYVDLVARLAAEEKWTPRMIADACMQQCQKAILWLAEHDDQFLGKPEGTEFRAYPPGVSVPENFPARQWFPENPAEIHDFLMRAHMNKSGRLLLRTVSQATDPGLAYDELLPFWGDRICRLPVSVWSHWPEKLTPEYAERLYGVRVLFLDAEERWRRFPMESLCRLVLESEADWRGADGRWYRLPVPRAVVLCGPPVQLPRFESRLAAVMLEARPIWPNGGKS